MYNINVRNGYDEFVSEKSKSWLMGDYPLWLYIVSKYKIHFIDDVFSVYRILDNSASHSKDYEYNKKFIISTYDIRSFFCEKLNERKILPIVENIKNHEIFCLAYTYRKKSEIFFYYKLFKPKKIKDIIKYIISYFR
jgi:hypothetical protein